MKKILVIFIIFLSLNNGYGQQILQCDSTKSFLIMEFENTVYTLKIIGNVVLTDRKNVFSINNNPLQYLVLEKTDFISQGKTNTELEILTNYVTHEVRFLSDQFKTKLEVQMQQAPLSSQKDVLIWWFKMPDGIDKNAVNQLFASIIIENKIFVLASPQFRNQEFEKVRDFLMDLISTVKIIKKRKI